MSIYDDVLKLKILDMKQNKIEIGKHYRVRKPENTQADPECFWVSEMNYLDGKVYRVANEYEGYFRLEGAEDMYGYLHRIHPSWLTPVYLDVNGEWVELGERVEASDWNDFGLMLYRYIQKIKPVDKPEPTPQEQDGHSCHMIRTLLGDIRRRGEFIRDNPSHKNVRVYGSEIVKKIDILMETSTPQEQHESLINRLKAMSQEQREEWIFRFNECEDL